ncbi:MAG: glycosyltransferase family 2 protein [Bacteroidales bacterium]|nr:glycosyltransferase family 2 protein [Bacteroidales bacterium]
MIKVSVIVPVFNAGDRIYRCLDTLVNQTLKEIEIICVLDCPTDGTDRVVEQYASRDDRIVVVHNKRNLHISGSRNEGLKIARGEYIGFSDHDDFRDLRMYELLYAKGKREDSDIVVSDVWVKQEDGRVEVLRFEDMTKEGLVNSVILPYESKQNKNQIGRSVWNNIYKSAFIRNKQIVFEDRRCYFEEDTLFNVKAFLYASNISLVSEVFYHWDKHFDSESNKAVSHKEACKRQLHSLTYLTDLLFEENLFWDYKESFYILASWYINMLFPVFRGLEGLDRTELVFLIKRSRFPLFGRYSLKKFSKKRLKLLLFVLNLKWDGIIKR